MREVNINLLVNENKYLNENILNDIILVGKMEILHIKYKYDQLDLSKIECNQILYNNQEGDSIKNHILSNSLEKLDCRFNKLTLLPNLPNSVKELDCEDNKLILLPDLPDSLKILHFTDNKSKDENYNIIHKIIKTCKIHDIDNRVLEFLHKDNNYDTGHCIAFKILGDHTRENHCRSS